MEERISDAIRIRLNPDHLTSLISQIYEMTNPSGLRLVRAIREVENSEDYIVFPSFFDAGLNLVLFQSLQILSEKKQPLIRSTEVVQNVKYVEEGLKVRMET